MMWCVLQVVGDNGACGCMSLSACLSLYAQRSRVGQAQHGLNYKVEVWKKESYIPQKSTSSLMKSEPVPGCIASAVVHVPTIPPLTSHF